MTAISHPISSGTPISPSPFYLLAQAWLSVLVDLSQLGRGCTLSRGVRDPHVRDPFFLFLLVLYPLLRQKE